MGKEEVGERVRSPSLYCSLFTVCIGGGASLGMGSRDAVAAEMTTDNFMMGDDLVDKQSNERFPSCPITVAGIKYEA